MSVAVPVAMFLIGNMLYLLAAVRWPQHVPLPLLGALLERLPPPPELRLPRRKTQAPPRAHGGAGEPRTAPTRVGRDETGARRFTIPDWLTIPFRLRRTEGEHTVRAIAERTLIFDELRGQYRHAETGPMTLPQQYLDYAGKAREDWWPS